MKKSAFKRAGLVLAPVALAIGLGAALAAPQTGSKPCYKLVMVPT